VSAVARKNAAKEQKFDRELDVRGLHCPMPALRARLTLTRMKSGQVLRILATDPGARRDFATFAMKTGHALIAQSAVRREFIFYLRKA